jgi:ATP-dependent DNA helicase RecQ
VRVDHERFNTLRLTDGSREVLRGERQLRLRRPAKAPAKQRSGRQQVDKSRLSVVEVADVAPGNELVYEALRTWRREVSKQHGVPAYTVFHDSTLRELARVKPQSLAELRGISGIGASKLERYGEPLLTILSRPGRS